jgi:hypothetical protein
MMRQTFTQRFHFDIFLTVLALLFCINVAAHAQSLGDIARENREKKDAEQPTAQPRVITNATLPKDPDRDHEQAAAENKTPVAPSPSDLAASRRAAEQRAREQRAAQQWKRKILAQQATVANLRFRVDRLKASIQFVNPNTSYDYYEGVAQNRYQARQLEHLAQLQQQLAQEKSKLENMQEAARKAGMHTATYDP